MDNITITEEMGIIIDRYRQHKALIIQAQTDKEIMHEREECRSCADEFMYRVIQQLNTNTKDNDND